MLAFHSDQAIKDKYIARVKAHQEADEVIQGEYWENGKGCAVGCTLHSGEHSAYEDELGIPRTIARLEDGIFEGLPLKDAKLFPLRFLEAVKVGSDLSMVVPKFMLWLLIDEENGVISHAKTERTKKAILDVAGLYKRKIAGEQITLSQWREARAYAAAYAYAAADAAADAAYAAAYAYAADAADAAADAAAYAAADAAYAAAYAYAAADAADAAYDAAAAAADAAYAAYARKKLRIKQADKLMELLKSA